MNFRTTIFLLAILCSCAVAPMKKDDFKITEKYWKLVSLNGEPIQWKKNQQREAHFILKEEENKVNGNTGCNSMGGSYQLLENNRIKFSRMISTKMYCEGVNYEQDFLNSLQNATSYKVKNDTLFLLNNNKDTIAKLEVVYL